ncbi:alpha/beta hydrolase [Streptomyces sp. P9-2B-2]|uniref:alpha/beta fold hydrolase n=1 Tax=Streptomyces TaxID=1883 RepID=UPI002255414B|nr:MULTISPECIES: alpha/beta hydrolase [Streptomyces]MCX4636204.1 alpha/beta fold hydrolase [Streptomyces platensis]WJY40676.1 alpha/beta hydrolase [Streptomyces sp. P9-2B-2]
MTADPPVPTPSAAFRAAYEQAMALWPVRVERLDLASEFGSTRVTACGPADDPPLVLLHGGGTTSAVWYALAASLARTHRVYAVDLMGGPGLSVPTGRALRRPADLLDWLDGVFRGLGLTSAALLGHSYGGWLALNYAGRAAPGRVNRLVLLDPTQCFAGFRPSYLLRALPLFVRPGERSTRRFLEWETGGAPPAPELLRLMGLGAVEFRTAKVVTGPRPNVTRAVPTLLLLAGRSRTHDPRRVAARAERTLAGVRIATLAGATHHSLPYADPEALGRQVLGFLPAGLPGGTP